MSQTATRAQLEGRIYFTVADLIAALKNVDEPGKLRVVLDNLRASSRRLYESFDLDVDESPHS